MLITIHMHMELMTLRIGSNSIVANNNLDHALGYKAESHESVTVGLDLSYIELLGLVLRLAITITKISSI